MYGLDARKDPSRLKLSSPPPLNWLGPQDSLWRTIRFEQRSDQQVLHYTVHIVATNNSGPTTRNLPPSPTALSFELS